MPKKHTEIHGKARLIQGKYLVITTPRKRGEKYVDVTSTYLVEDVCPDPRCADPAFSLTKGELRIVPCFDENGQAVDDKRFEPTGEIWHVHVDEWGPSCDCPWRTFNPNSPVCKHAKAMQALGLLKKNKPVSKRISREALSADD